MSSIRKFKTDQFKYLIYSQYDTTRVIAENTQKATNHKLQRSILPRYNTWRLPTGEYADTTVPAMCEIDPGISARL